MRGGAPARHGGSRSTSSKLEPSVSLASPGASGLSLASPLGASALEAPSWIPADAGQMKVRAQSQRQLKTESRKLKSRTPSPRRSRSPKLRAESPDRPGSRPRSRDAKSPANTMLLRDDARLKRTQERDKEAEEKQSRKVCWGELPCRGCSARRLQHLWKPGTSSAVGCVYYRYWLQNRRSPCLPQPSRPLQKA